MRSILGLDNSAPFPLMSSRNLDKLTNDISTELPSDREVMKLFRTYKEIPHAFWGFVIDIDDLESKLMVYLEERAKNAKNHTKVTKPVSASWLAVFFAVLAIGSQYHDSPYHIRTRDSQKYIQISFHFLRVGNFILRPNLDSIQALTMIGFVLLNDMKAEGSWALLGLTCRLAQSLGLDRPPAAASSDIPETMRRDMIRKRLWWTVVWHDVLTSLSFDRTPMIHLRCPIPLTSAPHEGFKYLDGMYNLCHLIASRLTPDATASSTYAQMLENCNAVEAIREKMMPHFRNRDLCKSALDRLQHFAFRLHTSFVMSVCCRPALRKDRTAAADQQTQKLLRNKCKTNLIETVQMFLAMHQLSVIPTRSWAFTYHGLSSAVMLGIMGETNTDTEVRNLQGDLISALSATAAKEQNSPSGPAIPKTDKDIELSGPLSRALAALKNIYEHGSVSGHGIKKENGGGSGTRTPLPAFTQFAAGNGSDPQKLIAQLAATQQQGGLDPHQDAALAMAEMQNGTVLQDFSGYVALPWSPGDRNKLTVTHRNMLFPPLQAGMPIPNMQEVDPSYMSPMDVYDQIFWGEPINEPRVPSPKTNTLATESPDPWNTGVDSMNFDFMAQPPPGQAQQQFYF